MNRVSRNWRVKYVVPVFVLCATSCLHSGRNALLGTWRETTGTNIIVFSNNVVSAFRNDVVSPSPLVQLSYSVKRNSLLLRLPNHIVIDKLDLYASTNQTIIREFKSHIKGTYTDWVVPFHVSKNELQITWNGQPTRYVRTEK